MHANSIHLAKTEIWFGQVIIPLYARLSYSGTEKKICTTFVKREWNFEIKQNMSSFDMSFEPHLTIGICLIYKV